MLSLAVDEIMKKIKEPEFNPAQINEILFGLEQGVDVSIYAKPEFNYAQMWEIRNGLEKGIDVNIYAKPEFVM